MSEEEEQFQVSSNAEEITVTIEQSHHDGEDDDSNVLLTKKENQKNDNNTTSLLEDDEEVKDTDDATSSSVITPESSQIASMTVQVDISSPSRNLVTPLSSDLSTMETPLNNDDNADINTENDETKALSPGSAENEPVSPTHISTKEESRNQPDTFVASHQGKDEIASIQSPFESLPSEKNGENRPAVSAGVSSQSHSAHQESTNIPEHEYHDDETNTESGHLTDSPVKSTSVESPQTPIAALKGTIHDDPVTESSKSNNIEQSDDDFDDFEDFTTAAAPSSLSTTDAQSQSSSAPVPTTTSATSAHVADSSLSPLELPAQPSIESEERIISNLLKDLAIASNPSEDLNKIQTLLKKTFPIQTEISSTDSGFIEPEGLFSTTTVGTSHPSKRFESEEWYNMWMVLSSDPSVTGAAATGSASGSLDALAIASHEGFRWRKSHTRKLFIDALTGSSTADYEHAQSQESSGTSVPKRTEDQHASSNSQSGPISNRTQPTSSPNIVGDSDLYEKELLEAKRLCDITEDEMRQKPTEEIRGLVSEIMRYHQRLQDQANYWLDAKEKLVVDAEMQNRLIASLVQLAQQQQIAPRNAPKKKKAK